MQPAFSKVNTISSVLKISWSFSFRGTRKSCCSPRQSNHGIEALALLALETFEQLRVSVGEQVFDLFIGEGTVCLQAEHGQPALRVVAADDLAVELHTARSALGTLAAGIPAGEQFVAREQFGGNFPRVRLYLLAEGIGRKFPALNACQLLFPFARHATSAMRIVFTTE